MLATLHTRQRLYLQRYICYLCLVEGVEGEAVAAHYRDPVVEGEAEHRCPYPLATAMGPWWLDSLPVGTPVAGSTQALQRSHHTVHRDLHAGFARNRRSMLQFAAAARPIRPIHGLLGALVETVHHSRLLRIRRRKIHCAGGHRGSGSLHGHRLDRHHRREEAGRAP